MEAGWASALQLPNQPDQLGPDVTLGTAVACMHDCDSLRLRCVTPYMRLGVAHESQTGVHACCRLTGFFLGGHDRDLYIKCTSSEFANLPMIDVMQGGCIMTCSHFEKAAGRELSKKCVVQLVLQAGGFICDHT